MDRSTLQDSAGPPGTEYTISTGGYNPTMSPSTDSVSTTEHSNMARPSVQVFRGDHDIRINDTFGDPCVPSFSTLSPRRNMEAVIQHPATLLCTQPIPRKAYFLNFPEDAYIMPAGPTLNFTMTDILVVLPNWFKNQQLATRFMNNGLTSAVHVAILREHRTMNLSESELTRLQDGCSDQYRRTMRQITPKWTKAGHRVSDNWNRQNLMVNQFRPDASHSSKPIAPPPVPFKELMFDIKKLPQGPDAGDLTRALDFALNNHKIGSHGEVEDFLFPDDIHVILNQIGYATITTDHFDVVVIFRYDRTIKDMAAIDRKHRLELESAGLPAPPLKRLHRADPKVSKLAAVHLKTANQTHSSSWKHESPQVQQALTQPYHLAVSGHQISNSQPSNSQRAALSPSQIRLTLAMAPNFNQVPYTNWYSQGSGALLGPENNHQLAFPSLGVSALGNLSSQNSSATVANSNGNVIDAGDEGFAYLPEVFLTPPDAKATIEGILERAQPQGAEELFLFEMKDVDALMAQHQNHDISALLAPFPGYGMGAVRPDKSNSYPSTQLQRECAEADDQSDFSALARAARFCREPKNFSLEYVVSDLDFVMMLQGILE
jgi:hypothetical protein